MKSIDLLTQDGTSTQNSGRGFCPGIVRSLAIVGWIVLMAGGIRAQESEIAKETVSLSPSDINPYRRILVRQSDLPELPLDGWRPIEIDKLPEALERFKQATAPKSEPVQNSALGIASFHASAKLVGADLLSERSRIRWEDNAIPQADNGRSASRILLNPWSLALDNPIFKQSDSLPTIFPANGLSFQTPTWLFDENGRPYVRNDKREEWFTWSLRPLKDSTPYRLNYSLSIPRTTNSCLLLQLPKGARITDSSVVSRLVDAWPMVQERLGDWPINPNLGELGRESTNSESLWILEISGQETANFSIQLGSSGLAGQVPGSEQPGVYSRLISRQSVQCVVASESLRTICEWEWNETGTADRSLRLILPVGARMRSLTLNDREPILQISDRTIDIALPPIDASSNAIAATTVLGGVPTNVASPGVRMRLMLELLAPLPSNEAMGATGTNEPSLNALHRVAIEPIEIANAYVVSGTTSLIPSSPSEIVDVSSSAGRLEGARALVQGSYRLDYSWFHRMPKYGFAVAKIEPAQLAEIVTRISTDNERVSAAIRMQLSPWSDHHLREIHVSPGWKLESTQLNSKSNSVRTIPVSSGSSEMVKIESTGPPESLPIQLEIQLSRDLPSDSNKRLDDGPIVELPGWRRRDVLIIEPSPSMRLELPGAISKWMLDEESLTPWQRDRLPRLGKYVLMRMPAGILPPLQSRVAASVFAVDIDSTVSEAADRWYFEHRFKFPSAFLRNEDIPIECPPETTWTIQTHRGRKRLAMDFDATSGRWELDPVACRQAVEPDGMIEVFASITLPRKGELSFSLPSIASAVTTRRSLTMDPRIRVLSFSDGGIWQFSANGMPQRTWNDQPANASRIQVHVAANDPSYSPSQSISMAHLHVAIDSEGEQKACLQADYFTIQPESIDLQLALPGDWQAIDATVCRPGKSSRPLSFHREGSVLRLQWANALDDSDPGRTRVVSPWTATGGSSATANTAMQTAETVDDTTQCRIEILFRGPKLIPIDRLQFGFLPQRGLQFTWPELGFVVPVMQLRESLWIFGDHRVDSQEESRSLLAGTNAAPASSGNMDWAFWDWTNEALIGAGWRSPSRTAVDHEAVGMVDRGQTPPESLIPAWMNRRWRLARSQWVLQEHDSMRILWIHTDRIGTIHVSIFALAMLLTPWLLHYRPWWCFCIALLSIVAGHWLADDLGAIARYCFVGLSLGTILHQVYLVYSTLEERRGRKVLRGDRWLPWNEAQEVPDATLDGNQASRPGSKATFATLLLSLLACTWWAIGNSGRPVFAQDPIELSSRVPQRLLDIIVPVDAQGETVGTVVYVPEFLLKEPAARGIERPLERDAYLISARHILRLDSRSIGFGNPEQACVQTYEFWIGDQAIDRPIRIPFQADRTRLSRFTVDGTEVISSRFARTETELLWYPDRTGRRLLQVETQTRLRAVENPRSGAAVASSLPAEGRSQKGLSVEAPILPCANAILEIEADGQWTVDLAARGKLVNPSIGRFALHLGSIDRISGVVSPMASPAARPLVAMPSDSPSLNNDFPVMNTEILIDREQLMARTTIEFPRSSEPLSDLELESDAQWQPVGASWGDAQLVDVRPGSTLDRKRYILRWTPENGESNSASPSITAGSNAKRVVTTTWIPVGDSPLRNVLFAECRDRRVRPGTLRYARAAGSSWTIEGINTNWIPSINARERLEWPELLEKPIATSLRIPASGGFGVLKQQPEAKPVRARINNSLTMDRTSMNLRSKLEFSSLLANRATISVQLPGGYRATKATSRNMAVPFLQWKEGESNRIQFLLDRDQGEVNEITLACEGPAADGAEITKQVPFLGMQGIVTQDQLTDIAVDSVWRITITTPKEQTNFSGAGVSKSLMSIPFMAGSPAIELVAQRCTQPWQGLMIAYPQNVAVTGSDWQLRIIATREPDQVPDLELSLPIDWASRWSTSIGWQEALDWNLQRRILLLRRDAMESANPWSNTIDFNATGGMSITPNLVSQLNILGNPDFVGWFALDRDDPSQMDRSKLEIMDDSQAEKWLALCGLNNHQLVRPIPAASSRGLLQDRGLGSVSERSSDANPKGPSQAITARQQILMTTHTERGKAFQRPGESILQSCYWIEGSTQAKQNTGIAEWTWSLPEGSQCLWVLCNGESVPFHASNNQVAVHCQSPHAPTFVEMWIAHIDDAKENSSESGPAWQSVPVPNSTSNPVTFWIDIPSSRIWRGTSDGSQETGEPLISWLPSSPREFFAAESIAWLEVMEQLQSLGLATVPDPSQAMLRFDEGLLGEWNRFLARETYDALWRWTAVSDSRDRIEFPAAMVRWKDLRGPSARGTVSQIQASTFNSSIDDRRHGNTIGAWRWSEISKIGMPYVSESRLKIDPQSWRWISTLSMTLTVVLLAWFWQMTKVRFLPSPWWHLVCIGMLAWLVTGMLVPSAIAIAIGLILAIDSYWMINERFRQTAIRGPR
ncbi:MAG: hypothetical protein WCI02_09540 [Planctomycetota bacterium]